MRTLLSPTVVLWGHSDEQSTWITSFQCYNHPVKYILGFPGGSDGKESVYNVEIWVQSLGWEDPLEKGIATHSSILAWRIPWTEEPGGLQSMGSQGVGHD